VVQFPVFSEKDDQPRGYDGRPAPADFLLRLNH
jgi:hypothetical protein